MSDLSTTVAHVAILPRSYELLTRETVGIDDLSDVDVLDLVGRAPVKHDLRASAEFVRGRAVLITGAAGSIGSQLARLISAMGPSVVVCVDWWENGMFYLQKELSGVAEARYRVVDVGNRAALDAVFTEFEPDLVFHAAAYKHVPLMQENPRSAVVNNVGGTRAVFDTAVAHGVGDVVYVSTDKAVNPVNVMGATKRLGEMLLEVYSSRHPATKFNAVRFGNVIQSNGSVMQTFRSQIARREALTVTDPEVTRYFMTVDEASQLIVQSAFAGAPGEIFVLDMGEPVRIADLARSLIDAVDPSLGIEFVGLRPGEKMYEELSYEPDAVDRTRNDKIFVVKDERAFDHAEFLDSIDELVSAATTASWSDEAVLEALRRLGFSV
jgi:FlaA1/EpsC-like NDP-sugar epimerase